jgi:uncharacterized coiled-coil DUF342 family protein
MSERLTDEQLRGLHEAILDVAETDWRDEDIAAIVAELLALRAELERVRRELAGARDEIQGWHELWGDYDKNGNDPAVTLAKRDSAVSPDVKWIVDKEMASLRLIDEEDARADPVEALCPDCQTVHDQLRTRLTEVIAERDSARAEERERAAQWVDRWGAVIHCAGAIAAGIREGK